MAAPNFTIKVDLATANRIRAALEHERDSLQAQAHDREDKSAAAIDKRRVIQTEANEFDKIIKQHF